MTYWKKEITCGKVKEIEKYYSYTVHSKNIIRGPKTFLTTAAQQKLNERNAEKKLRRLINTNFGENDLWLSLTYSTRPKPEAAKEIFEKKFLKALRRAYKKAGLELKYIHILEVGNRGGVHHHMLVNHIDPLIISKLWKYGFVDFKYLDNSGQYAKIAQYMIKYTAKNYSDPEKTFCKKRYSPSKNLKQPQVKTEIVKAASWKEEPVAYAGYIITECYSGVSALTGYPYQYYTMVQTPLERGYATLEELKNATSKTKKRRSYPGAGSAHSPKRKPHVQKNMEQRLF